MSPRILRPWLLCAALLMLAGCLRPDPIRSALKRLQDPAAAVRRAAVEQLGGSHDVRILAPLLACLQDPDPGVRAAAVSVLGGWHELPSVGPILDRMQDPAIGVRRAAAAALGGLHDLRAVDPLLQCLTADDAGLRRAAVTALGQIGDTRAVGPLMACLNDEHPATTAAALDALGALHDGRAAPAITFCLASSDERVRGQAVDVLCQLGAPAVEPLLASLTSPRPRVRVLAAEALGRIGDPRAVDPLVACLKNPGPPEAAGPDGNAPTKNKTAVDRDEPGNGMADVRQKAAEALGRLGRPAVEPLIACLGGNDDAVSKLAAETLGDIQDARAIGPLIDRLVTASGDENYEGVAVRGAVIGALTQLGTPAIAPLVAHLQDKDLAARKNVAEVLADLKYVPADAGAKAEFFVLRESWDQLVKLGAAAFEPLAACLADKNPDVRRGAIRALGALGDRRAIPPLAAALPDWDLNGALVSALEQLGWKPAAGAEEVYDWIGRKDSARLKERWKQTRRILLADVGSHDRRKIENAVDSFVAIGQPEILADLVRLLDQQGNAEIAEIYLNSRNDQLERAARAWADRTGCTIIPSPGAQRVSWGRW